MATRGCAGHARGKNRLDIPIDLRVREVGVIVHPHPLSKKGKNLGELWHLMETNVCDSFHALAITEYGTGRCHGDMRAPAAAVANETPPSPFRPSSAMRDFDTSRATVRGSLCNVSALATSSACCATSSAAFLAETAITSIALVVVSERRRVHHQPGHAHRVWPASAADAARTPRLVKDERRPPVRGVREGLATRVGPGVAPAVAAGPEAASCHAKRAASREASSGEGEKSFATREAGR